MRALAFLAACAAIAGCGADDGYGDGAPAPAQCSAATAASVTGPIALAASQFVPACAKVVAGTTVTFANQDAMLHTVTDDAGGFDSGELGQGATYTRTFAARGTVRIHCTLHPGMRMTLIVE